MIRTPEHLTTQFAIAPSAGNGRAVPRVLLAYTGPNKSRFLKLAISAIVAGALPEYGQKKTWRQDVSQADLAAMCNVSRETYTRWMSEVATPDESWDVPRRLSQRDRALELHQRRGNRLHDGQRLARPHVATLVGRRRRFMRTNVYTPLLPDPAGTRDRAKWYPPSLQELAAADATRGLFRAPEAGEDGYRHFKEIPQWVWDARLPLSSNARLVMSYYFLCGLARKDKRGQMVYKVHPRQRTVAEKLGISVRTVYVANQELEALSLIRVIHPKPLISPDGSYRRGPQEILYLPIRTLTSDEANEERRRLQAALAGARSLGKDWMVPRLQELHGALLGAWQGQEHSLGAFWNQMRRNAINDGITRELVNLLIPSPPE